MNKTTTKSSLKQFKHIKEAFKKEAFLKIILYDLMFYFITAVSFFAIGKLITTWATSLDLAQLGPQILSQSGDQIASLNASIFYFIIALILLILLGLIILVAAWSFSRGMMYALLLKKKFDKTLFWKNFGFNFLISLLIILILLLFSRLIAFSSAIYIFYVVILVVMYFTALTYIQITKSKEIFSSIGKALSFGTKEIKKLWFPVALITALAFGIGYSNTFLQRFIPSKYVGLALLILFAAWARMYFVQEVERKH